MFIIKLLVLRMPLYNINIIVSGHETLKQRRAHIKEFEGEILINSVILIKYQLPNKIL